MHERKPSVILPALGTALGGLVMIGSLAYLFHDGSVLFNIHPGGLGNFANWGELINYDRTTTRALFGDQAFFASGFETARRSVKKLARALRN